MTHIPLPFGTSRLQGDGEHLQLDERASWTPAMVAQQELIDAIEADLAVTGAALDLLRGELT